MVDLCTYYKETVSENEYYICNFGLPYKYEIIGSYWISDDVDAINKFKNLIMPYNERNRLENIHNEEKFIYLCNYLHNEGYYIKQFPEFLQRPTSRWDFSYNMIRDKLIEKDKNNNGIVSWKDRRIYVNSLEFISKKKYDISDEMNLVIQNISTRNASFEELSMDEKLKEICNAIEFLLKKDGKFLVLDYSNSCGYLSDELVKKYRNKLECFRHSTEEALEERKTYLVEQKNFLIKYGLLILDFIKDETIKNGV